MPDEQLEQIHQTALRILAELGIRMAQPEMRERLAGMGCRVSGERVFIPRAIASAVVANIPSSFCLYGRDALRSVCVKARGQMLYTNSGIVANIVDFDSGEVRRSTRQDVVLTTRLLDALPNVDFVYVSLVDATEMPPHMVTVTDLAVTLENTTKPLGGPGATNRLEAEAIVGMARAMRGDDPVELAARPVCAPFIAPITPLTFPVELVEALCVIAKAALPLMVVSNPVMGVTAPSTLAGTAALGHAEVIASAVMAHAVRPGLPILSHNTPSIADMRTLTNTTGGPEIGLLRRTIAQVSRHVNLPSWAPGHTSSARLDIQAGDEKSINALLTACGRPAILGGLGGLANITLTAYESLVLDDERYGALKRVLNGVAVDDDHLALDVMAEQIAGVDVVSHPHTLKHLRSGEVWMPRLANRRGLVNGCPEPETALDRAHREARRIMETHTVAPLSALIQARITNILDEYDQRCRVETN